MADQILLNGEKLFPLVSGAVINCNSRVPKIELPLSFCKSSIVSDDSRTRFIGQAKDGKKWEIDLAPAEFYDQCLINVFVGDLSNNGVKDLIIEYSYPGASGPTAYGDAHLLFVLFDKDGYPHPKDFFVHLPSVEAPLKILLQDPEGRAILVHKRLERSGESLEMLCYASFYRVVGAGWEKLSTDNLKVINGNPFSSFSLESRDEKFDNSDQAMELCSGMEGENSPDYSSNQVTEFLKIESFKIDKKSSWPNFKFVVKNKNGKNQKVTIAKYESCYVAIEKQNEIKIINFNGCDVKKELTEMMRSGISGRIIKAKNSDNYVVYFSNYLGKVF
ncbi:MAG TPA: hypothetical protein VHC50_02870 [Puia sp.]|nr:hypothetical protein [Puia sp.]